MITTEKERYASATPFYLDDEVPGALGMTLPYTDNGIFAIHVRSMSGETGCNTGNFFPVIREISLKTCKEESEEVVRASGT